VVVVLTFALFGDRGILHIFKQKRQQADLQQQLAEVEEVNAGLRKEIASLSADRRHLERLARSQLGWCARMRWSTSSPARRVRPLPSPSRQHRNVALTRLCPLHSAGVFLTVLRGGANIPCPSLPIPDQVP